MDTSNPNESYFTAIRRRFKLKNYLVYIFFIVFLLIASPLSIAGALKTSTQILFEQIGYTIIGVISLSLVVGFLGELSLGHAAFMSIGAFIGMYFQKTCLSSLHGVSPLLSLIIAMIVGGLVAGVCGIIIGLPALRLKGDYLAIVTLAFGEIVKILFQQIPIFGGAIGFNNRGYKYDSTYLFIIIFIVALLSIVLVKNLIKSKHGRAIKSIRDNEIAAKAMGVNVTYYKLLVFVISAVLAGVAGVLYGASKNQIDATTFNYNYSINNMLVMVVIGGMGNIHGSIVSAIVVTFLNVKLQVIFEGDKAAIKNIIYAVILIVIVVYNNAPSLRSFREKYNLRKLFTFLKKKIKRMIFKNIDEEKEKEKEEEEIKEFSGDWSKIPTKIEMDEIVSTGLDVGSPYDEQEGGK